MCLQGKIDTRDYKKPFVSVEYRKNKHIIADDSNWMNWQRWLDKNFEKLAVGYWLQ
jgi:hypothetical protein